MIVHARAKKAYRRFVMDGIDAPDPYDELEHDLILGSPQFIHWIWDNHTAGVEDLKEYPREQRIVGRPTLAEIFQNVATIKQRNRAIKLAKLRCGYLNTEIARHLNLDRTTVGKICRA